MSSSGDYCYACMGDVYLTPDNGGCKCGVKNKMKPISPAEANSQKSEDVPDFVIEAFNELIVLNFKKSTGEAIINQNEVVELIMTKGKCPKEAIFNKGWLDVEEIYKAQGWNVVYDKPSYRDSYEPRFSFASKGVK